MAVLKAVIASTDFPNVQEDRGSQSCSGGYWKRQSKHGFLGDDNGDGDGKVTLSNPPNGRIDIWAGTYGGSNCDAVLTRETF